MNPDFATVKYLSVEKQSSLLRAISPEVAMSLDGVEYNVGGHAIYHVYRGPIHTELH